MIEATLAMLRARHDERTACAGVIASLLCDQLPEAVERLEAVRDAAKECEAVARKEKRRERVKVYRAVSAFADDMIGPVGQLAAYEVRGSGQGTDA